MNKKYILFFLFGLLSITISAQSLAEAKALYEKGEYEEAKPAFKKLVKTQSGNGNYNLWYGVCCLETGEPAEALKHLESAVKRRVPSGQLYLARAYNDLYRFEEAIETYETYISDLRKRKRSTEEAEQLLEKSKSNLRMLKGVEEVCFIDSFVVDKEKFLDAYKISPESGKLFMYDTYFNDSGKEGGTVYQPVDESYFYAQLRHFVLFRTMQVLGAYGFRGYFEKKPHFIQSVPFAIENLRQLLQEPYPEYPYLCKVLHRLTELKQFTDDLKKRRLVVKVTSFAYKKGIPEDSSGNGGGFVFDCRAVNNPGKYERYKPFTGLDEPVVRFLEEDGEIAVFLEHVYGLVDASVKRYMERGFTNLSVCFGCTGGQHRSVYSAQHLAEHLNKKFGVQVNLIHREQNIEQNFSAKQ